MSAWRKAAAAVRFAAAAGKGARVYPQVGGGAVHPQSDGDDLEVVYQDYARELEQKAQERQRKYREMQLARMRATESDDVPEVAEIVFSREAKDGKCVEYMQEDGWLGSGELENEIEKLRLASASTTASAGPLALTARDGNKSSLTQKPGRAVKWPSEGEGPAAGEDVAVSHRNARSSLIRTGGFPDDPPSAPAGLDAPARPGGGLEGAHAEGPLPDSANDDEWNSGVFNRLFAAEREGRLPFQSSDDDISLEGYADSGCDEAQGGGSLLRRLVRKWRCSPLRTRTFQLMTDPSSSPAAWAVSVVILMFIIVSSVTFCLETIPDLATASRRNVFRAIEISSVTLFTVEYGIKLATADRTMEFFWNIFNLVDLAAILPFYVEVALDFSGVLGQTRILRVTRLVRVFRVLKLGSKINRMQVVFQAVLESMDILGMLLFLLLLTLVFFSSLMYFAEKVRSRRAGDISLEYWWELRFRLIRPENRVLV
eukprot:evm.model.scf_1031.4 EVM.evm.TU.scf_1031.4   scf_1031:27261-34478(-)